MADRLMSSSRSIWWPQAGYSLEYWLRRYRSTWKSSLISSFLSPLLYLGSLGFGLGSLVDSGGRGGLDGVPYAMFVAPGVMAAAAMQTAVGESTYEVMGAIMWHRQYQAMLATRLGVPDLVLGQLAFIVLRLLIVSTVFAGIGAGLGAFRSVWVLAAVPICVLCGLAHAAPVMAYAARQVDDSGFALLFRFVLVPMFLFAGTFFPVDQLPAVLRPVAWLTPLWHATESIRGLLFGRSDLLSTAGHLAYLLGWLVLGYTLALRSYRRRLVP
jgi:lipooligosaccharide transport system permease protein